MAKKCSETLNNLKLENFKRGILNILESSFVEVTSLTITSHIHNDKLQLIAQSKKLGQFFPKVVELQINNLNENDWVIIGQFASMTSVSLASIETNFVDVENLAEFFKINQQIETLKLKKPNNQVLDAISTLENLKQVDIDGLFEKNAIHFDNVEKVTIKTNGGHAMLEKMIFDQLQELSLQITDDTSKWVGFMDNHVKSNLFAFTLIIGSLEEKQLIAISEKFPQLDALRIECKSEYSSDNIIRLVEKSKHLSSLDLKFTMVDSDLQSLPDVLGADRKVQFIPESKSQRIQITAR